MEESKKYIRTKIIQFMKERFEFPKGNSDYIDDMIVSSYLKLSVMSRFITIDNKSGNSYVTNHKELCSITKKVLDLTWYFNLKEEEIDNNDDYYGKYERKIEKQLCDFGHIKNLALTQKGKDYFTNNECFKYKDACFQMGLPSKLSESKLSGNTFIIPFNNNYMEFKLESNLDVGLLITAISNFFGKIDSQGLSVINLKTKKYNFDETFNNYKGEDFNYNLGSDYRTRKSPLCYDLKSTLLSTQVHYATISSPLDTKRSPI